MPHCFVDNCGNYYGKTRGNSKVIYHMLPNEPTLAIKWVRACGKKELHEVPIHARVCSDHFSAKCYQRDLQHELLGLPLRRRLRNDAVPDRNLPRNAKVNKQQENLIALALQEMGNKPSVIRVVPKKDQVKKLPTSTTEARKISVIKEIPRNDIKVLPKKNNFSDNNQSKKVLNPLALENHKTTTNDGKNNFNSQVKVSAFAKTKRPQNIVLSRREPRRQVSAKIIEHKRSDTRTNTNATIHTDLKTSTPNKHTLLSNQNIHLLLTPISKRMPSPFKQYSNKIYEKFKMRTQMLKKSDIEADEQHEFQKTGEKRKRLPMRSSIRIAKKKSIECLSDSFTEKINNKAKGYSKPEKFSDKLKFMAKLQLRFQKNTHYVTLPKYNMELSIQKMVTKEVEHCGYVIV